MTSRAGSVRVREAADPDGRAIRALLTRAYLGAGLPPPSGTREGDLLDLGYYRRPGRRIWVAHIDDAVVGCAALDRSREGVARLDRLAGEGLRSLIYSAVQFARAQGYAAMEAVWPAGMDEEVAQRLFEPQGFAPPFLGSGLPYTRSL